MVILGVDPGSLRTGYGAIDTDGRRHRLIEKGFIAPPPRGSLPERLRLIHAGVGELIARLRPEVLAVEDVFHAANTRTALVLGHVRGVVLLAGAEAGLPVHEFPEGRIRPPLTRQATAKTSCPPSYTWGTRGRRRSGGWSGRSRKTGAAASRISCAGPCGPSRGGKL